MYAWSNSFALKSANEQESSELETSFKEAHPLPNLKRGQQLNVTEPSCPSYILKVEFRIRLETRGGGLDLFSKYFKLRLLISDLMTFLTSM